MKEEILSNLDNPIKLESLYRQDEANFTRAFNSLYPEIRHSMPAAFWHERLNFHSEQLNPAKRKGMAIIIIACLLAGTIAKIPTLFKIDESFFYSRNAGFIIFPFLYAYFAWNDKLSVKKIAYIFGATLASLLFINFLPLAEGSDTLILSCIHLPFFLWSILGYVFIAQTPLSEPKRLEFLRYNGELMVMTTLIILAGAILMGITMELFSLIGFSNTEAYIEHIVVFMLPAAPIIGTYLTQTNPQIVGKVSPVIAKIFSPLVLVMLIAYLAAIVFSGKDPYNDREFLLTFNGLLVGVMALIFFSVADGSGRIKGSKGVWLLFLLSVITIVVNSIALSAIIFRISNWGFTPNRAAVLGSNLLILINLFLVTAQFFKVITKRGNIAATGNAISGYLPVYALWGFIVTFIFPLIFMFK